MRSIRAGSSPLSVAASSRLIVADGAGNRSSM
jgi:hypothetical protein